MSLSMQKMWISIIAMILFALAMFAIYISRFKMKKGILKFFMSLIAWLCLIIGFLLSLIIVLPGPTS
ncbi:DUF2768 domain-containing protein [Bacillus sp. FJAT-50079]|uniref:DUF2768 domain-containing protein n=1 Tax=Bacillus sp. FJAT-50079 TaxID=2833577 RepID=UPI001BC8EA8F|nr:DUF2768 domain-containing protein [Bacillus sp. FJAT-50079]MBS4209758.1 DUF2768 domain-containing protein [Bacillus sp. FJAT-50079]